MTVSAIPDSKPAAILPVSVTHAEVLRLSLPMMLAYLTTPLVGLVDTALVGQLGSAALIGGVAIATVIFEVVLATMNFLRGGTTGLTAQAVGAADAREQSAIVLRAGLLALALGTAIVLLGTPIAAIGFGAFALEGAGTAVEAAGRIYFDIRIWSAPMMLVNYVTLGWLLGRGEASVGLALQLWLNGINIAVSSWLVLGLDFGIAGAAWGTVVAECLTAALGVVLVWRRLRGHPMPAWDSVVNPGAFKRLMLLNGDMLIRSFALLIGLSFFTQQSAGYGPVVLAANTVLMRFYLVCSVSLDGIALAAEQLAGKAVGARNAAAFERVVVLTRAWGMGLAVLLSLTIYLLGPFVIELLSTSQEVREEALSLLHWAAVLPMLGVIAFQMDGIFIGATWSRDMRNMMLLSLLVYFAAWAALTPQFGVDGLWVALIVFHGARSLVFSRRMRVLMPRTFPQA